MNFLESELSATEKVETELYLGLNCVGAELSWTEVTQTKLSGLNRLCIVEKTVKFQNFRI